MFVLKKGYYSHCRERLYRNNAELSCTQKAVSKASTACTQMSRECVRIARPLLHSTADGYNATNWCLAFIGNGPIFRRLIV